jgi:hypothetical protein
MLKKIKLIPPNNFQSKMCELFASEMGDKESKFYRDKSDGNAGKLSIWAWGGKMAEIAVYNTLVSSKRYKKISQPELLMHEIWMKSHDADIVADGKNIHIKSFIKYAQLDPTWLFSLTDSVVDNPTDNDILALVIYDKDKNFEAYFIPAKDVVDKYKEPMSDKIKAKALYEIDLIG